MARLIRWPNPEIILATKKDNLLMEQLVAQEVHIICTTSSSAAVVVKRSLMGGIRGERNLFAARHSNPVRISNRAGEGSRAMKLKPADRRSSRILARNKVKRMTARIV